MENKSLQIFNELAFQLICEFCKNEINCIYRRMLRLETEGNFKGNYLGFWIWDFEHDEEIYSPQFRETLGYAGEHDFPNVPQSWMDAILPSDLKIALDNFAAHVKTKGQHPYAQHVTYRTKQGRRVSFTCHGKVVTWEGGKPKIMIGVHLG